MQISAAAAGQKEAAQKRRLSPFFPSLSPLFLPYCLSLIFMEPKRSHGPLKRCVCVIELWDHRKCLQFISIMPLRLLAGSLFIYLAKLTGLSLRSVQFLLPSFVIFQQLFMPPTRPDATNLYIFSAFPLPWTHLTRNLACQAASLPGPVVQRRGPPRNQLLTWHNLWANHANLVFSVPLWNHTTSDAGGRRQCSGVGAWGRQWVQQV